MRWLAFSLAMVEKVGLGSSADSGKGKSKMSKNITHGYHLVKGKSTHPMEDYVVAQFRQVEDNELGLFAIFDGHLSHEIPDYLRTHLFETILNEDAISCLFIQVLGLRINYWTTTSICNLTSGQNQRLQCGELIVLLIILFWRKQLIWVKGGSTAVTAILINCQKLVVANLGDSRAIICKNGVAKQLSIDHEPSMEKDEIEGRGGFVSNFPGDVPRVDGQLAVARAFGDKSLKKHLSSEPDVEVEMIDNDTEFIILASDGLWKVMSNQEAADAIKNIKDARSAAKHLTEEALARNSSDDISVIVVRFG
ncbi:hypothetical protein Patl1_04714 [Pistacia atlantica]|uniref:Uncharacterized protein n=1 Tax=Pistacia atlantica TaxID=434234 RepID=A0ACC1BUI0_9ROSI|nr:hypothetical protein Patl1_04714 [Pistacia atlantica]